jgi:RNA polymerase-binding protein DksA
LEIRDKVEGVLKLEKQIDLAAMRKRLRKQQKVLNKRIEVEMKKAGPDSIANPDRADLAHDYSSRERRISMVEQLEDQLDEVGKALKRIEDDAYGRCTNCGNFILPERLEALPYAELCIDCQRLEVTR